MFVYSSSGRVLRLAIACVAGVVLVLSMMLAPPARAATANVTGSVTSSRGSVASGYLEFYATCDDYDNDDAAAYDYFTNGTYNVTVPTGSYKVHIWPDSGAALRSWHNAKPDCASADTVTVSGNGLLNLVATSGSLVTGSVSSSNGAVSEGLVFFYKDCADYDLGRSAATDVFSGQPYSVTVPDGTYKVQILPGHGYGAVRSWHSAKADCASADTVSVAGDVTRNLTASPGSNVTGSVASSRGPVNTGPSSSTPTALTTPMTIQLPLPR